MQLTLKFPDETVLPWQELDEAVRAEVVEKLARLIARAALPNEEKREKDDE